MDAREASSESVQISKGISQAANDLLNSHMSLLSIELEEAKQFYRQCFTRMAILIIFSILFLVLFSMGVIIYFWDTYRLLSIAGLLSVYLLVIFIASLSLFRLQRKTKLFTATKEELIKNKGIFCDK